MTTFGLVLAWAGSVLPDLKNCFRAAVALLFPINQHGVRGEDAQAKKTAPWRR
jgi:hypothetical protein